MLLKRRLRSSTINVKFVLHKTADGNYFHLLTTTIDDGAQTERQYSQRRWCISLDIQLDLINMRNSSLRYNCF